MSRTPLAIHDELLLNQPEGARHEADICPFCTDWAMTAEGTPSGFSRLDAASQAKPYGEVTYADPGFQSDGVSRYPIDTEAHALQAWEHLTNVNMAVDYSAEDLAQVRGAVVAALSMYGHEVISQSITDAASEGGTHHMDTISKETHEALLEKATKDATEALTAELAELKTAKADLEAQVADLTAAKDAAEDEVASLKEANETLNGTLDNSQVALKAAQDEVAALKADVAAKEEEARLAEIASARADQVRNLGLFGEDYVTDKSSAWAAMDEAAWTERLEEWKAVKGSAPAASVSTDTASALSGTREAPAGEQASARRQILGLAQ